jgi:hypothetical protein
MKAIVREAFLAVRGERSPDVVVADPDLNEQFLSECRSRGLAEPPRQLNLTLLNLRKSSHLQGIKSKRVVVNNQEDFCYASEIAVRFLERRDQLSLDLILCDPRLAAEFDEVASGLAPGFSAFQYRWAALNLRKRKRLRPELLGKVIQAESVVARRAEDLKPEELPVQAGLYLFSGPNGVLYVGECQNLRKRLGKHLDHSDNRSLARWLWEHGSTDLRVEYHVLPPGVSTRARKAMEAELIRSRKPLFNVAGAD